MVATDLVISQLDKARLALCEAKTIPESKRFVDIGVTAETWAKQQKLGDEIIGYAHSFTIDALANLGRMLKETSRNEGGNPKLTSTKSEPVVPTLADLGIERKTSSMAQKLAALPKIQLEQVKARTSSISQAIREVMHAQRQPVEEPTGTYRVIYADPPWSYGDSGLQEYGHASHHYPNMTIDELCALKIADIAQDNAVLFLWVTSPLLEECFPVIKAWGFKYKTSFVWDKIKHNFGHYNSVRHELLLVCTRGSCTPDVPVLIDSVQSIERSDKHSEKPEEFRTIIDTLYTQGQRIELFSRAHHSGWDSWGNEVAS